LKTPCFQGFFASSSFRFILHTYRNGPSTLFYRVIYLHIRKACFAARILRVIEFLTLPSNIDKLANFLEF
jgi:hypothetical protein